MKKLVTSVMFLVLRSNTWCAEDLGKASDTLVKLLVGGERCTISMSSLTVIEDSMLNKIICGTIPTKTDEDGYIIIDANGRLFKEYIAQWLRRGEVYFPHVADALNTFKEADYYMLLPLKKHIWEWMKAYGGKKYFAWVLGHKKECLTEAEETSLGGIEPLIELDGENFLKRLADGIRVSQAGDMARASKYLDVYNKIKHHKELTYVYDHGNKICHIPRNAIIGGIITGKQSEDACFALRLIERAIGNHVCTKNAKHKFAIFEIDTGNEVTDLGAFETADACIEVLNEQYLYSLRYSK